MEEDSRAGHFLIIDDLQDNARQQAYKQLRQAHTYIEQFHSKDDSTNMPVPGGLIHRWVGLLFIPDATVAQTLAVLWDYDNHKNIYKPYVRNSRLLERNGNESKTYLQLYKKSLITVVLNANCDITDTQFTSTRAQTKSYSTRIAEVANQGKPDEHEVQVGMDHGNVWRLYTYWRIEEKGAVCISR